MTGNGNRGHSQALSNRGLARKRNEDAATAVVLTDGSHLLVVADGIGGHPGGDIASRVALDAVIRRFQAHPQPDPAAGLRGGFESANTDVRSPSLPAGAGTTLVAAVVRDSRAWIANLGDSRAYLVDGTAAIRLTADHSWVEEQVRAGLLDPADPLASSRRNFITRAIGLEDRANPDLYGPVELSDRAILLLCSDGLHGVLEDDEISAVIGASSGGYAADLVAAVLARGAPDNVSVALLGIPPGTESPATTA